jgi:hypothetical protein
MEAAHSSETLVPVYQSVWCYVSQYSNLHSYIRENFKSKCMKLDFLFWIYLPGVHHMESAFHWNSDIGPSSARTVLERAGFYQSRRDRTQTILMLLDKKPMAVGTYMNLPCSKRGGSSSARQQSNGLGSNKVLSTRRSWERQSLPDGTERRPKLPPLPTLDSC